MTKTQPAFGVVITDVTRLFRKHFDRRAAKYGLTRAQWRALKMIGMRPGMRQADLAEFLELEPIAVSRVIDRLRDAGFVERRACPDDRRAWRLHVTTKAGGIVDNLEKISDDLRRDAVRGIKAADIAAMQDCLERIKANLAALESPLE